MERITLKRFEHWPRMLGQFIESQGGVTFAYGEHDCMMFAADCIWYLTGIDPAWQHRGSYATADEAQTIIDAAGGMEDLITSILGIDPVDTAGTARRGDIVLVDLDGTHLCGVIDQSGEKVVCMAERGIVYVPPAGILKVWSY